MTTLETHLYSINFSTQLEVVKNILDKAETRITFWGTRLVEVGEYTGSITLESIASRVLKASNQRCEADDLTLAERVAGLDISKRVENLYLITDKQIQNANLLTRLFRWIREFSFIPTRLHFVGKGIFAPSAEEYFQTYSKQKFIRQFGSRGFDKIDGHPAVECTFSNEKILISKNFIREKLAARWFW